MRRRNDKSVLVFILFILAVLVLAWWIAGELYRPYPPAATPTTGYWPTRITATIVPSATPTRVIVTPIQPTIGYTETPMQPPVTVTPAPTFTPTLTATSTPIPILYSIDKDKETWCVTYFIRPWGIKKIDRCWTYQRVKDATPTPCWDCIIWWPPIPKTPPFPVVTFTGSPIFIP